MKVWNYHTLHELHPWPDYFVYVGRDQPAMGLKAHPFCNPFPPPNKSPEALRACLETYRDHLWMMIQTDVTLFETLKNLHDKHLVCFCVPAPCHADIIKTFCQYLHAHQWSHADLQSFDTCPFPDVDSIAKKSQWVGWSLTQRPRIP